MTPFLKGNAFPSRFFPSLQFSKGFKYVFQNRRLSGHILKACFFVIFSMLLLIPNSKAAFGQATCGFDHLFEQQLQTDPQLSGRLERSDSVWEAYTQSIPTFNPNARITIVGGDTVFEIPVVIHVLNTGGAIGTDYNPADTTLENWINYLNQVYAGTYPGYPQAGQGGVALPVKFVLAKRDPNCQATSGITRTNLSANSAYTNYGINSSNSNGLAISDVTNIIQWPTDSYYNLYVVNRIDGEDGYHTHTAFVAGFAFLGLYNSIPNDGAYMLAYISHQGQSTLPHEIGHALGLYHTFQGSNGNTCPSNNNCHTDGDKVCDTDPGISLLGTCPAGTATNSCTNQPFGANRVQHNIMNYSQCPNHFTQGQADRMMWALQTYRLSLINSLAAVPLGSTLPSPTTACIPNALTHSNNGNNMGPAVVLLDSIQYASSGYNSSLNDFYIDHTGDCLHNYHTSMIVADTYALSVSTLTNTQNIVAYIDYNNNGTFESSEKVMNISSNPSGDTATVNIIPPTSAVMNTPLRMRIIADYYSNTNITSCSTLQYGQTEDFSVSIIQTSGNCSGQPNSGSIDTSGNSEVCKNTTFDLTATGATSSSGITYQWQRRTPAGQGSWANISGATTENLHLSSGISDTTDFRFIVTCNSNLSDTSATVTINTNANLCACVTPSSSSLFATNIGATSAKLTWTAVSPTPGNGYDYYYSTSNTSPTSTTTPSGNTSTTTITLNGLSINVHYYFWVRSACTNITSSAWTQSTNFTTNCTPPVVSLGPDTTICDGQSITLDAGNPGSTYHWNTSATTQTIQVTSTGYYSVTVTDSNSCSASDTRHVTVRPTPVVNLGTDTSICYGDQITLHGGYGYGYTYLWNTNATTRNIQVNTPGTYWVTVSRQGCSATDTIIIQGLLRPFIDLGNDTVLCSGHPITLDAGNPSASHLWNTYDSTQTIQVATAGTYSVKVTNTNGCSSRDTINVGVTPSPFVDLIGDTAFCTGKILNLDAGSQPIGTKFTWNTGDTTQVIHVSQTGNYWVIANNRGCLSRDSVMITVDSRPHINSITGILNRTTRFYHFTSNVSHGITSYQWRFGDGSGSTDPTPRHSYTGEGIYKVTLIATNYCGSDTMTIYLNFTGTSINQVNLSNEEFKLYPNPAKDRVTLENVSGYNMKSITVYNILGQKVFQTKVANPKIYVLNVSSYASGIYNVRVEMKNGGWLQRKFEINK